MGIGKLVRSRDLILYRAYADLRSESKRTYLGVLWWILAPIITTMIYYVVFRVLLRRGGEDFIPFLFIGLVMWRWFDSTVSEGARAILNNRSMLRQVALPKIVFPATVALVKTFKFAFSFMVLFFVLWLFDFEIQKYYLALPVLLIIEFLFIMAVMLPLSAIVPFFPDMGELIGHVLQLMFFLSCIFYSVKDVGTKYEELLYLNPMILLISSFRDVLMREKWPYHWDYLVILALLSALFIYVGAALISHFDKVYAKRITM